MKCTRVLGRVTSGEGCTFIIRIDLLASPGLGESIQICEVDAGASIWKARRGTGGNGATWNYSFPLKFS